MSDTGASALFCAFVFQFMAGAARRITHKTNESVAAVLPHFERCILLRGTDGSQKQDYPQRPKYRRRFHSADCHYRLDANASTSGAKVEMGEPGGLRFELLLSGSYTDRPL